MANILQRTKKYQKIWEVCLRTYCIAGHFKQPRVPLAGQPWLRSLSLVKSSRAKVGVAFCVLIMKLLRVGTRHFHLRGATGGASFATSGAVNDLGRTFRKRPTPPDVARKILGGPGKFFGGQWHPPSSAPEADSFSHLAVKYCVLFLLWSGHFHEQEGNVTIEETNEPQTELLEGDELPPTTPRNKVSAKSFVCEQRNNWCLLHFLFLL